MTHNVPNKIITQQDYQINDFAIITIHYKVQPGKIEEVREKIKRIVRAMHIRCACKDKREDFQKINECIPDLKHEEWNCTNDNIPKKDRKRLKEQSLYMPCFKYDDDNYLRFIGCWGQFDFTLMLKTWLTGNELRLLDRLMTIDHVSQAQASICAVPMNDEFFKRPDKSNFSVGNPANLFTDACYSKQSIVSFLRIKLQPGITIPLGLLAIIETIDNLKNLHKKVKNEYKYIKANLHNCTIYPLHSFGWNEITLVVTCSSMQSITDLILSLRHLRTNDIISKETFNHIQESIDWLVSPERPYEMLDNTEKDIYLQRAESWYTGTHGICKSYTLIGFDAKTCTEGYFQLTNIIKEAAKSLAKQFKDKTIDFYDEIILKSQFNFNDFYNAIEAYIGKYFLKNKLVSLKGVEFKTFIEEAKSIKTIEEFENLLSALSEITSLNHKNTSDPLLTWVSPQDHRYWSIRLKFTLKAGHELEFNDSLIRLGIANNNGFNPIETGPGPYEISEYIDIKSTSEWCDNPLSYARSMIFLHNFLGRDYLDDIETFSDETYYACNFHSGSHLLRIISHFQIGVGYSSRLASKYIDLNKDDEAFNDYLLTDFRNIFSNIEELGREDFLDKANISESLPEPFHSFIDRNLNLKLVNLDGTQFDDLRGQKGEIKEWAPALQRFYYRNMLENEKNVGLTLDYVEEIVDKYKQYSLRTALANLSSTLKQKLLDTAHFEEFIELYPAYNALIKAILMLSNSKDVLVGHTSIPEMVTQITDFITGIENSISDRSFSSYVFMEHGDSNPHFKGGVNQILSIFQSLAYKFMKLLSKMDDYEKIPPSTISVGVQHDIINQISLGNNVAVNSEQIFRPDRARVLAHEISHYFIKDILAKRTNVDFMNSTFKEYFEGFFIPVLAVYKIVSNESLSKIIKNYKTFYLYYLSYARISEFLRNTKVISLNNHNNRYKRYNRDLVVGKFLKQATVNYPKLRDYKDVDVVSKVKNEQLSSFLDKIINEILPDVCAFALMYPNSITKEDENDLKLWSKQYWFYRYGFMFLKEPVYYNNFKLKYFVKNKKLEDIADIKDNNEITENFENSAVQAYVQFLIFYSAISKKSFKYPFGKGEHFDSWVDDQVTPINSSGQTPFMKYLYELLGEDIYNMLKKPKYSIYGIKNEKIFRHREELFCNKEFQKLVFITFNLLSILAEDAIKIFYKQFRIFYDEFVDKKLGYDEAKNLAQGICHRNFFNNTISATHNTNKCLDFDMQTLYEMTLCNDFERVKSKKMIEKNVRSQKKRTKNMIYYDQLKPNIDFFKDIPEESGNSHIREIHLRSRLVGLMKLWHVGQLDKQKLLKMISLKRLNDSANVK